MVFRTFAASCRRCEKIHLARLLNCPKPPLPGAVQNVSVGLSPMSGFSLVILNLAICRTGRWQIRAQQPNIGVPSAIPEPGQGDCVSQVVQSGMVVESGKRAVGALCNPVAHDTNRIISATLARICAINHRAPAC